MVRESELYWRYVSNFKPWLRFQLRYKEHLNDRQKLLLHELKSHGIAITTAGDLMGDTSLFKELETSVRILEAELSSKIEEARKQADGSGFKTYLIELLGLRPVLDPNAIFVRFGLQPVILGLVNQYFGMYTRLRHFNVWHTFPSKTAPRNSQLWHRDPEDHYIVKMFVYLTDVNEKAGPLIYAPSTHARGNIKSTPESFKEENTTARRSNDDQMSVVVPPQKWVTAIGSKGTIIFADTRGYHKGGMVREGVRTMYTCTFTSQASSRPEYFERKLPIPIHPDKALTFALGF
jgi:Phytanoyl-CoA dioxygenase (PhyH)